MKLLNLSWVREIQYPKLTILLFSFIVAYLFMQLGYIHQLVEALNSKGYLGAFIAGLLFTYGFTSPFAVAIFIDIVPEVHIGLAALIGGFGALISDIIIFRLIRSSFQDEFDRLKLTRFFTYIHDLFHRHLTDRMKQYVLWASAGFLIASPLPDEFGITLLSGFTNIQGKVFTVMSYALNTVGIFVILLLTQFISHS